MPEPTIESSIMSVLAAKGCVQICGYNDHAPPGSVNVVVTIPSAGTYRSVSASEWIDAENVTPFRIAQAIDSMQADLESAMEPTDA